MKNYLFLFALLLPFSALAQAEIGFRIGVNMSELDYEALADDPLDVANHNGIQISAVTNFRIAGILSFQPELVFSQKGFQFRQDEEQYNSFLSNYLELPLMLELGVPLGENFQLFGDAGPSLSYLLSAKERYYDAGTNSFSDAAVDFDLREELQRIDYGLNFGGGFSFRIRRSKLTFDLRYQLGMNDIMDIDSPEAAFRLAKNRLTNIAVGYSYLLFGKVKR